MPLKLNKTEVQGLQPRERPYEVRDAEIKGLVVRVNVSGLRVFWLRYALPGKRSARYRIGTYPNISVEAARKLAKAASGEVAKGMDPHGMRKAERVQAKRDRRLILQTFLTEVYEPYMTTHFKSAAEQLRRIRSDFKDYLNKPMTDFHRVMIEGLRRKWIKSGKQPTTINRDIQRLGSVLTQAVRAGVLDRHPLKDLVKMKTDRAGRVRYLSAAEEAALRDTLTAREERMRAERIRMNTWRIERHLQPLSERKGELIDHLKPLVLLALNTGMRRGELFSLKWAQVNFDSKILTVIAATAKSGQTRRVPLNAEAIDVLIKWRERNSPCSSDDYVFPGSGGARLTHINTSWRGVARAAQLSGFNFHDLRHTFASKLVQAGVDLNTVRELLGHSEISMTLRYSHLAPDGLAKAVESI